MNFSRFLKYWLPVLVWIAVIFIGSSDLMSAEHTSRFLSPFLRWLKPDISADAIAKVQLFVRKAAHLAEYAILAVLLWRALRRGTHLPVKMSLLLIEVWLVCGIISIDDEFHLSFLHTCTASYHIVLIEISG